MSQLTNQSYSLTVQFEDVDNYGIVHHSCLVRYFERSRVDYLLSKGVDVKGTDYKLLVHDINIRILQPAEFLDNLNIEVRNVIFDGYKCVFNQRIRRLDKSLVKSSITLVFVDKDNVICSIPDGFISLLS
ncbi:MAG: acyl-CoA thioesterase [Gammaproteobacteria bacterium]|nr:acyl-CoA thioesterase [Gammaproteobacteria bacterium]